MSDGLFAALAEIIKSSTCPLIAESRGAAGVHGTGTLLESNGLHYLVTAQHVARDVERLAVPAGDGPEQLMRTEETWTLGKVAVHSTKEPFDVAVVHLQDDGVVARLRRRWRFLPIADVTTANVVHDAEQDPAYYLVVGYPSATSPHDGSIIHSRALSYATKRVPPPAMISSDSDPIDPRVDFWLAHASEGRRIGSTEKASLPHLRGISGGGVWRPITSKILLRPDRRLQLAGIETGFNPGSWIRCRRWEVAGRILVRVTRVDSSSETPT